MPHNIRPDVEKLFNEIFNFFSNPVLLYDIKGKILKANKGVNESLGYLPEELSNTMFCDLLENSPVPLEAFLEPGHVGGFYLRLKPGIDMSLVSGQIRYLPANLYSIKATAYVVPAGEDCLLAVFTLLPNRLSV